MNQVTNKIPYGLLSKEDQAQFSGEAKTRGLYELWADHWMMANGGRWSALSAYRLIIKDDEWYYGIFIEGQNGYAILGKDLTTISGYDILRPATTAEIEAAKPKELTLEEKVKAKYSDYNTSLLTYNNSNGFLYINGDPDCDTHVNLQSFKGFYRYVYQHLDGDWDTSTSPTMMWDKGITLQPIAVMFNKDCN